MSTTWTAYGRSRLSLASLCAIGTLLGALGHTAIVSGETRPGYGGTVIGSILGEPVSIDPTKVWSHAEVTVVGLLFDTLYRVDGKQPSGAPRIVPHIAAAMPMVSKNRLEVRIPLRDDIKFHNGSPLGAADIVGSLRRLRKSGYGYLLASVRAIDSRTQSKADERGQNKAETSVVLSLSRPTPELASLLTAPVSGITPGGRAPTWKRAVGSGPFKLARIERKQRRVRLLANRTHFAGRPYIDKLTLRWFAKADDEATEYELGRAHLSLRGDVAYEGHTPKYRTGDIMGPATLLVYAGFGHTAAHGKITDNRDFRRALSLALERDGFRSVSTGERITPTVNPVASPVGGPVIKSIESRARIDQARAVLARASENVNSLRTRTDRGQTTFVLELIYDRTRPDDRAIAEKVIAALFRLGVKARIVGLDATAFNKRVLDGACDLYIGQLPMPVTLPSMTMAAAFARGGDRWSRTRLSSAQLDVAHASQTFARRLPIIPLFHRALRVHHRHNVRGIQFDDTSRLLFSNLFFFGRAKRSE